MVGDFPEGIPPKYVDLMLTLCRSELQERSFRFPPCGLRPDMKIELRRVAPLAEGCRMNTEVLRRRSVRGRVQRGTVENDGHGGPTESSGSLWH